MNAQEVKEICKWIVDHGNRPINKTEKEIIKQAIDQAKTVEELAEVAVTVLVQQGLDHLDTQS